MSDIHDVLAARERGEYKKSKFHNNSGRLLIRSLFEGPDSIYSYEELGRLYVEKEDIGEYEFATEYLYSWDHWLMLCDSTAVRPYINKWREELHMKLKSRAINNLREEASDPANRGFVQANRYLIERGYTEDKAVPSRGRGRPKKVAEGRFTEDFENVRLKEDAKRILGSSKETVN